MSENQKYSTKKLLRALIGAGMAGTSLFQLALPVLAQTAAGTVISNTATASYEDDNNNNFTTTSNTVEITIAEVAGITVTPAGIEDENGGSVQTGDTLNFNFLVTNTGNDPTAFYLPGITALVANNQIVGAQPVTTDPVTVVRQTLAGGTPTTLNVAVPDAGAITNAIAGVSDSFAPGDSLVVQVAVTVLTNPTDDTAPINVTYGDTGDNDNTSGTQNQPDDGDGPQANEVRTVDNADNTGPGTPIAGEIDGDPANGEREASAFLETNLSTEITDQAMLTVLKQSTTVSRGATDTPADDLITYRIDARVEADSPNGSVNAASLVGTNITLNNTANEQRILISDAIPADTEYDEDFAPLAPTSGGPWIFVYTTDPLTSTALEANWVTTPTINATIAPTVTRVGWISESTIPAGTTTEGDANGFEFRVITSGIPAAGGNVYNLAQGFGGTEGGADVDNDGTPDDIVYDESGDDNPNNISDNGSFPNGPDGLPDNSGGFDPEEDDGVADPEGDGLDNDNDNSGEDEDPDIGGGEDNVVPIIGGSPDPDADILNGPDGEAGAVNRTDDDDFQNLAIPFDTRAGASVTFTNTVQNNTTNAANTQDLNNVVLLPLAPSVADAVNPADDEDFGENEDIPDGTTITITFDPEQDGDNTAGTNIVGVYTYTNAGGWDLDEGNGANANLDDGLDNTVGNADDFINIGTLAPLGGTVDYTVVVTLPGTADPTLLEGEGVPIPIVAFPNSDEEADFEPPTNPGGNDGPDTVNNITVDRVYVGFLVCLKDARILNADGSEAIPFTAATLNTQTLAINPNPTGVANVDVVNASGVFPGQIIEYRVVCTNTSEENVGTGNTDLNANNVLITEDGTGTVTDAGGNVLTPDNDWALDTDTDGTIDTSHVIGQVEATTSNSNTPTINYFSGATPASSSEQTGTTQATDVTQYTVEAGTLAPGESVTFTFQREIN